MLGIIVSILVAYWVDNYYETKAEKQMMRLVMDELLENQAKAEKMCERILLEKRAARYLQVYADSLEKVPKDSMKLYASTLSSSIVINFTTDAMEALKASGLLSKIDNEEMILQIFKGYGAINELKISYTKYFNKKTELRTDLKNIPAIKSERKLSGSRWNFYLRYPEGYSFIHELPQYQSSRLYLRNLERIDNTLSYIKQVYGW